MPNENEQDKDWMSDDGVDLLGDIRGNKSSSQEPKLDADKDQNDDTDPPAGDSQKNKDIDLDRDDPFELKRNKPKDKEKSKQKPTKEESIEILRQERDRLLEEKKKLEDAGLPSPSLKKIEAYLKEKYGNVDEKTVENYILKNKSRKEKLTEYEKELAEKEARLRGYDICSTKEWQENYKIPQDKARDLLVAAISVPDAEGNPRHWKVIEPLFQELVKKEYTSLQIKAMLMDFSQKYEEKTGEKYVMPSVTDVVNSVELFHKRAKASVEAFQNWETRRQQEQMEEERRQEEEFGNRKRKEFEFRKKQAQELINEFDYDSYADFIAEEEIEDSLKGVFRENEDYINNPSKLPPYKEILKNNIKSKLFDKLFEEYKELKAWKQEQDNEDRSGLSDTRTPSGKDRGSSGDKKHWMGDVEIFR